MPNRRPDTEPIGAVSSELNIRIRGPHEVRTRTNTTETHDQRLRCATVTVTILCG